MIEEIQAAVTIPVMAKARIGHFVEAQVLEALEVDYIDESEVLTPADEAHHIDKRAFKVPFVCGATNLGEALRRIAEGAAMIRTKGEAGTGNVVEAVRHMRTITGEIRRLGSLDAGGAAHGREGAAGPARARPRRSERGQAARGQFSAGGIATPADAALMMQLGAEGIFVGSGIFKSDGPGGPRRAAIVEATTHYDDPERVARASRGLGEAMPGIEIGTLRRTAACSSTAAGRAWRSAPLAARAVAPGHDSAAPSVVGVLALQGGFEAHVKHSSGSAPRRVRCGYRTISRGSTGC